MLFLYANNLLTQTQVNTIITLQYIYDHICLLEPNITTTADIYGKGDVLIVYSNVNCQGWEKNFSECSKSSYLDFTCTSNNIYGVLCTDGKYS